MTGPPPISPLFPSTPLFRSGQKGAAVTPRAVAHRAAERRCFDITVDICNGVKIAGGTKCLYQRDPIAGQPALTNNSGRQFGKSDLIQFRPQRDDALNPIGESKGSAGKRSVGLRSEERRVGKE